MLPSAIICVAKWIMLPLARVAETIETKLYPNIHNIKVVNVVVHNTFQFFL